MPNKKSAIKRVRQAAKARVKNRQQMSSLRTAVKRVRKAVEAPAVDAATLSAAVTDLQDAQKKIGKAAKTGLIKKNTAARLQSRMAKAVKKAEGRKKG